MGGSSMNKKRKERILIIVSCCCLLLVSVFIVLVSVKNVTNKPQQYATYTIKPAEPLAFKGISSAKNESNYYLDATLGRLDKIHVTDGQKINVGDVLFTYINDSQTDAMAKETLDIERQARELRYAMEDREKLTNKIEIEENKLTNLDIERQKLVTLLDDLKQSEAADVVANQLQEEEASAQLEAALLKIEQTYQQIDTLNDSLTTIDRTIETTRAALFNAQNERDENVKKQTIKVTAKEQGLAFIPNKNVSIDYTLKCKGDRNTYH